LFECEALQRTGQEPTTTEDGGSAGFAWSKNLPSYRDALEQKAHF
jgi:hypothetical protein